jgi:ribonucleoside-diphosphate reductase alpha chain
MQVLSTGKTEQKPETTGEEARSAGEIEEKLADAREECHRLRGEIEKYRQRDRERDRLAGAGRHKRKRPALLKGRTVKMDCPLGDLYVTINEDETGRPFEVFCTLGKAGGAAMADAEAIGRLISLALRSGIPITAVRDQLRGISCDRAVGFGLRKVLSAPDAIGQAIEYYLQEKDGIQEELILTAPVTSAAGSAAPSRAPSGGGSSGPDYLGSCPECGTGQLSFEEGCVKCHVCGFSECS